VQSSRAGLGLGLFVCKELVRRQGGQIWFEPQPKGGTLSFTLPANP
jgi:signal transduction histidine kinase